jgi:DNA-3-methyladenine glycosylase II
MDYLLHLAKDKKLKKLIEGAKPLRVQRSKDMLFYLITSIMSQQLSAKVADTIRDRFLALYDGRIPSPDEVLATAHETLRSIGLSNGMYKMLHVLPSNMALTMKCFIKWRTKLSSHILPRSKG